MIYFLHRNIVFEKTHLLSYQHWIALTEFWAKWKKKLIESKTQSCSDWQHKVYNKSSFQ